MLIRKTKQTQDAGHNLMLRTHTPASSVEQPHLIWRRPNYSTEDFILSVSLYLKRTLWGVCTKHAFESFKQNDEHLRRNTAFSLSDFEYSWTAGGGVWVGVPRLHVAFNGSETGSNRERKLRGAKQRVSWNQGQISGGSKGTPLAPPRPIFFQFHAVFWGNFWQNRLLPFPRVSAPSYGECWNHPCKLNYLYLESKIGQIKRWSWGFCSHKTLPDATLQI